MIQTAIILAGGFGTRLKTVVADLPKPMAPVNGIPFLNYQLNYLKHYGINKVIFSTGHLAEKISEYYGNVFNGIKIDYSHEESPLGTGGGIRLAMESCEESKAFVLNGDSFFDVNLTEFYRAHVVTKTDFSLAIRKVKNASRYGTIEVGDKLANDLFAIKQFAEKTGKEESGSINGGTYILDKEKFLQNTKPGINFSIEKDFFEKQNNLGAFLSKGYFIDIGIPEDYEKAQHDFKEFKYR